MSEAIMCDSARLSQFILVNLSGFHRSISVITSTICVFPQPEGPANINVPRVPFLGIRDVRFVNRVSMIASFALSCHTIKEDIAHLSCSLASVHLEFRKTLLSSHRSIFSIIDRNYSVIISKVYCL